MSKKKKEDPLLNIKLEIAEEIGVLDKVKKVGWGGLSSTETGRIGGILTHRLKQNKRERNI